MFPDQYPLVTVVTLVYNTGSHIVNGLASVKNQFYSNIQHIIIDDCSTDDSAEIVADWIKQTNYTCTFIRHDVNKGICVTINEALKLAEGEFFAAIGDDIMLPDKIQNDVKALQADTTLAFCHSKMISRFVDVKKDVCGHYKGSNDQFRDYIEGNFTIATPTVTYRKAVFDEIGLFDEMLLFEDFDMYLRILYRKKAVFLDYFSVVYIRSEISIQSKRQIDILNEFLRIIETKWSFLPKYAYYKNNRHQFTFCQLSVTNKKEALKHLVPALKVFWKPRLYKNIFKLVCVHPRKMSD